MPTASEFRSAAASFDDAAEDAPGCLDRVKDQFASGEAIEGGVFSADVTNALLVCDLVTAQVVAELEQLAIESRRRADVCEDYAGDLERYFTDYGQYEADLYRWELAEGQDGRGPRPNAPTRPGKPATWVEL